MPILLVEDDPGTLYAYAAQLRRAGLRVVEAETGQWAIDELERGLRPSAVVVDLRLGRGVSGDDVLTLMHVDASLRNIPTVVVTGMPRDEVRVVADAVLWKPLKPGELVATVLKVRDRQSAD